MPDGLNIYPAPTEDIVAPAVVLRPSVSWMKPHAYCFELEQWDAMPVVSASTPEDGIALLRSMALAIIGNLTPPWDWQAVDGPIIDRSTGVPFLANRIRLTYQAGDS